MLDILCVGTPKLIGDAIGPLVGTMLEGLDLPLDIRIIGTLRDPVTSKNYNKRLKEVRPGKHLVVIDAAVGSKYPSIEFIEGPLQPGSALTSKLQPIGDSAVKCYTGRDLRHFMSCDLNIIYTMARHVVDSLVKKYKIG